MKKLSQEKEDFLTVISITENKELAEKLIKFFLIDYPKEEQEEILTKLADKDKRFVGWESSYMQ
ncbi:MAG: hypothetical protein PHQ67_03950, partial [Fermentimonas sp.]|nr:hypothetical protein [Fermentimonas sp.]